MSNGIDTRSPFFPRSRTGEAGAARSGQNAGDIRRNSMEKAGQIMERTSSDAKVSVSDGVKEFARIKKAVDASAPVDNSEKIARLKAQIQAGSYEIDYDALADKMLTSEL